MKGTLFKPDMLKAIREGGKTVTRRLYGLELCNRLVDKAGCSNFPNEYRLISFDGKVADFARGANTFEELIVSVMYHCKPRYQVGDVVYIKEALYRNPYFDEAGYLSDKIPVFVNGTIGDMLKWRWQKDILSAMFMPKEAARDFIQITGVRAERLQEITEGDAIAEGIQIMQGMHQSFARNTFGKLELIGEPEPYTARYHYEALWDSINKGHPWASNPWVWVYEFKRIARPCANGDM